MRASSFTWNSGRSVPLLDPKAGDPAMPPTRIMHQTQGRAEDHAKGWLAFVDFFVLDKLTPVE
jgi:hypothetical protein